MTPSISTSAFPPTVTMMSTYEWNCGAAGEKKDGLQRRAITERELELKTASSIAVRGHGHGSERVEHLLRNRCRHDWADHEREMKSC